MENNLKDQISALKIKIKDEEKILNADKEECKNLYIKLYSSCNHFKAVAHVEEDSHEGRNYFYSRCIRCGLDEMYVDWPYRDVDNEMMVPYLDRYGCIIPGFKSSTDFDYYKIKGIYNTLIENNPNITNEELEAILIEVEKKEKEEENSNGISRTRK